MSKHKLLHFIASFAASFIKIIFSTLPVSSNNSLFISLLSHSKAFSSFTTSEIVLELYINNNRFFVLLVYCVLYLVASSLDF